MKDPVHQLRARAIEQSLFASTTLGGAVARLGFVQADPIRAPARAQDLILRHRVAGYRAGDLERRYASLKVEEDVLYAYGFVSRDVWRLIHPRTARKMTGLEKKVLQTVQKLGRAHPGDLEPHFGTDRIVNAWGGYSKATTHALDHLHYRGMLRVAGREKGIRIYEPIESSHEPASTRERLRELILLVARILSPVPEKSLRSTIARFHRLGNPRGELEQLIRDGDLVREEVGGLNYIEPPSSRKSADEKPRRVRFLAPFDPIVWDRRRFEHLWGWAYRFEAYTPMKKRIRGYYALPLLWGNDVIGWANVGRVSGGVKVDLGFVKSQPRDVEFRRELEFEIESLAEFLQTEIDPDRG